MATSPSRSDTHVIQALQASPGGTRGMPAFLRTHVSRWRVDWGGVFSVMPGTQLLPARTGWRAEMGPLGRSHGPGLQFLQQGLMRNWGSPSLPAWARGSRLFFLAFPAVRGASVTWPWGWVMSGGCGSKAMGCCFS